MKTTIIRPQRTLRASTSSQPILRELVGTYLEALRRQSKSPRTLRTYTYVLDSYLSWFGTLSPTEVTLPLVEGWVLRERRGPVSNMTLRKDAVIARGFHTWASERGVPLCGLSTLRFGKLERGMPRPVDDDVWRKVWLSELDPLDKVWLGLGYFAGLRRLEIIQLQPSDVDLGKREVTFVRKGGFHANVEYGACFDFVDRELPYLTGGVDWVATFEEHVARRKQLDANYVWPDTLAGDEPDCNRLNKRCTTLTKRLGLPAGALTPHRLRHSAATNLLRCNVPIEYIQRQLAHSSMDITQRYLQMSGELARAYHGDQPRGRSHA